MNKCKKWMGLLLCMLLGIGCMKPVTVLAESKYPNYDIYFSRPEITIFLGNGNLGEPVHEYENGEIVRSYYPDAISTTIAPTIRYSGGSDSIKLKIYKNFKWSNSNPEVLVLEDWTNAWGEINKSKKMVPISEGTSTIKLKSSLLDKTITCKVHVKKAELYCPDSVYYIGNTYSFKLRGDTKAVSFASSNPAIATIDEAGKVEAKKAGSCILSCVAEDGNTYTYKMKVEKPGLSYKKVTTYYYTGLIEGGNDNAFPLVAKGIEVKSWKSSNKKVATIQKQGNVGSVCTKGTGSCTITCTATNGKKYKCKLTVVGGKTWGGLSSGYRPTLSQLKTHGYYKDINTIADYGNAMVGIYEMDKEIDLKNGNPVMDYGELSQMSGILRNRFPNEDISSHCGGSLLFVDDKDSSKRGRIWIEYAFVDR